MCIISKPSVNSKLELQSGNAKFESKLVIFFPCDIKIWQTTLKNYRAPLLCYFKLCVSFHSHVSIQMELQSGNAKFVSKSVIFFVPCDLEIWWMTLNKANLRDLIAATGLVILLKLDSNRRFFSLCDLEIWWMTQKTIGHLFYATSSLVQHFVAIGEFKLELQSGNAQSRSNSTIFRAVWPWNLTDDLQKQ